MKFGKIEYLNLLPFDIFIKKYPANTSFKLFLNHHKSFPSKLNKEFLFRRIDAGFISSIAGMKSTKTKSGIISYGAVWSVIAIENENSFDYQSASSNALSQILKLNGEILIGDRALKYTLTHKNYADLGQKWWDKHHLPFVFGLFCYQKNAEFYQKLSHKFNKTYKFNKSRAKIPHYILTQRAKKSQIPASHIKKYLEHIHYHINHKAQISLQRFYREVRLGRIKRPSRF